MAREMTAYQAGQRVRAFLIHRYGLKNEPEVNKPTVWTAKRSKDSMWSWAGDCVHVVWESSEAYDWPYEITEAIHLAKYGHEDHGGDTLVLPGIFCEPATGFALAIYQD